MTEAEAAFCPLAVTNVALSLHQITSPGEVVQSSGKAGIPPGGRGRGWQAANGAAGIDGGVGAWSET